MGKLSVRTPTGPLLLPSELAKDSIVTQCIHILINIAVHRGVEAPRVEIETPRPPDTRTRSKWRAICIGVAMDECSEVAGRYQRQQQIIIEIFY